MGGRKGSVRLTLRRACSRHMWRAIPEELAELAVRYDMGAEELAALDAVLPFVKYQRKEFTLQRCWFKLIPVKQSPWTLSEARTKEGRWLYAGGPFELWAMAFGAYIVDVKSIVNMLYF